MNFRNTRNVRQTNIMEERPPQEEAQSKALPPVPKEEPAETKEPQQDAVATIKALIQTMMAEARDQMFDDLMSQGF